MFDLMLVPFIACVIFTGIHVYLGFHVIEREVIFVDLALAQIAALGSIIAFLFGIDFHTNKSYLVSLLFTFFGAALFSLTRLKERKVPQEAIIGIVYVVSSAIAIMALSKSPKEAEHIKSMLAGNILFVRWHDITKIAILYSIVGIFHYIFRRNFLLITLDSQEAEKKNISIKLWDFLFYASFGIVVTSSVEIAGVLLVFSYLIIPAVCAMIITDTLRNRLITGWIIGILGSFFGLFVSGYFDFPTGPSIICVFGLLFAVGILVKNINFKKVERG